MSKSKVGSLHPDRYDEEGERVLSKKVKTGDDSKEDYVDFNYSKMIPFVYHAQSKRGDLGKDQNPEFSYAEKGKGLASGVDFTIIERNLSIDKTSSKDESLPGNDEGWIRKVEKLNLDSLFEGVSYLVNKNNFPVPRAQLKDKYVIIASFLTPFDSGAARHFKDLMASSKKLPNDVRIVIVSKMCLPHYDSLLEEETFNNFLSGFPDAFLAVPWSNQVSRDYIAWSIGLPPCRGCNAVIIGPTGNILRKDLDILATYGAASFPFTHARFVELIYQDDKLKAMLDPFSCHINSLYPRWPGNRCRYFDAESRYAEHVLSLPRLTLSHLLENCSLRQYFGPTKFDSCPTSALDGKLVGLYLPKDGFMMREVSQLHEQFKDQDPPFEVVMVPYAEGDDPYTCKPSWFSFPYDDNIYRTLKRIAGRAYGDSLILLPYGDLYSGEVKAHAVISLLGNRVYPFTREKIFLERLCAIVGVTLPSLLTRFRPALSPEHFEGKNTLLCLCRDFSSWKFSLLVQQYSKIQEKFPDSVVVFVPSDEELCPEVVKTQKWLIVYPIITPFTYPTGLDLVFGSLLPKNLGESSDEGCILLAFGKDGHLLSRNAESYLSEDDDIPSLFTYHLTEEIIVHVSDQLSGAEYT